MPTISIPGGTITVAEQREGRDSTGKLWRWEVQPATGCPWPLRKDGKPFSRLPGERSGFWEAVTHAHLLERKGFTLHVFYTILWPDLMRTESHLLLTDTCAPRTRQGVAVLRGKIIDNHPMITCPVDIRITGMCELPPLPKDENP